MKRLPLLLFMGLLMSYSAFEVKAINRSVQSTEDKMDSLFGEHQIYKDFFFQLKDAVLNNKRKQVSKYIEYPFTIYGEEYKYVIKNKTELLNLYDAIFSKNILTVFKQQQFKDLFSKWSGVMIGQGEIWFHGTCTDNTCKKVTVRVNAMHNPDFFKSAQGKKAFNDFLNKEKSKVHQSLTTFKEPVLLWHTKNHIIRIDRINGQRYRYAAWNITSDQSKKPNLIIQNGQRVFEGSGGNHHYEFKNGTYTYVCRVNLLGTSDTPPGSIEVFEKNEKILYQPVVKVLSL